jgi:hypothetical protein
MAGLARKPADHRWASRPLLARAVRTVVFLAPVAASFGAAWWTRSVLPPLAGSSARAGGLLVLVAVSTLVLLGFDRLARRAVPLATLLDLTMLFPDRAPSRLRVAREAIRRRPVEEQLRRLKDVGADPADVAREILTLVAALSAHDRPTRGHAERVRMFTDLLAKQLRIPERDRDLLRWAAILHDIGKLRVPASLLNKPGKPTPEEWEVLRAHPAHGAEMAGALLPWLGEWGEVILAHHERYDGTGYPLGLAGREISLGARIVSVADAYDVMTAARAYKRPVSRPAALAELVRFSGTQFDPVVVRAMLDIGVPHLRRAQGVLAWLSDLPLVATGSVPAATVARVVGAGALATTAVAGGVVADRLHEPPAHARLSAATSQVSGSERSTVASATTDPAAGSAASGSAASGSMDAGSTNAEPATPRVGGSSGDPASGPSPSPPDDGTGQPTSGGGSTTTSGGSDSSGGGGVLDQTGDAVSGTVDTVTGTVDDTVSDPVGTVTDTVQDPVGTVDDTVGTVTGTVDDTVGTLTDTVTGTGSDGSGSAGLLGGLLGGP